MFTSQLLTLVTLVKAVSHLFHDVCNFSLYCGKEMGIMCDAEVLLCLCAPVQSAAVIFWGDFAVGQLLGLLVMSVLI